MRPKVRPAVEEDKEPLMSFIKDIWGGHDYIPLVWDSWLHDPEGRMYVVEVGGVPVGMNRIRFLEDGSAWFEGARVHPDFRGLGLASMLGENSMRQSGKQGISIFRLTSGSTNHRAHRQISRIGFREAARFSVYEPGKRYMVKPNADAKKVSKGETGWVLRLVTDSKESQLGGGVLWHNFAAASLSREVVAGLVAKGEAWRYGDAVAFVRGGGEGAGIWEELCFVGGNPDDGARLVRSLVGRDSKATERYVFLPQGSPLIRRLREMGFTRNFSMILFERKATNG